MMVAIPKGIDVMPSGKYKATASIGSGKTRKRKSKSFETLSEAKNWMMQMNADMHSGITYENDKIPVAQAFDEWVATFVTGKVAPATERSYLYTGQIVGKYCENQIIKSMTRHKCQEMFNQLIVDGYSKTTIQKFKVHFTKFWRNLVTEGVIKRSPMTDIDVRGAKQGKRSDQKFISITQYKTLVQTLKKESIAEMNVYKMIILTILCTGMRVSEAVDLREEDLDQLSSTLRVDSSYSRVVHASKEPKTANSYRTIPVSRFLINRLLEWRFRQNQALLSQGYQPKAGRLFLTKDGAVPDSSAINFWVKKLQEEVCGIGKQETVTTHGLRHTYASYLLSREGGNQSIQYVAAVLGDTQEMVQSVYAHLMPEEKASQGQVVRDAFEVI